MEKNGGEDEDRAKVTRRIQRLSLHLADPTISGGLQISADPCARRKVVTAETAQILTSYMRGKHWDLHEKVLEFFNSRPDLQTPIEISMAEHRELCMRQLRALVREANIRPFRLMVEDPAKYFAVAQAVGSVDLSLGIKMGVQFSLWGGSVINLGTKKHKDLYFDKIDNLEYPGCFAMTELHHGSNVQALQTTATFDPASDEFIINTPNDGAIKWWIGNAAVHGKFATVFARLFLSHVDHGIHAFIVPLRDLSSHVALPGVEIRDCGHKIGLNGVDNGALKFSNVRIPRQNLLNRFADVSPSGSRFLSPI